jgi:DnaK suppressor protein
MDAIEREKLKQKIEGLIVKLEEEISKLEEATKPIGPENAIGRVSRMDAINNKSVTEASLRSSKRKLSSLRVAITKTDSPDFGICSRCKRPIAQGRLMFMPESTRCIHCAQ